MARWRRVIRVSGRRGTAVILANRQTDYYLVRCSGAVTVAWDADEAVAIANVLVGNTRG